MLGKRLGRLVYDLAHLPSVSRFIYLLVIFSGVHTQAPAQDLASTWLMDLDLQTGAPAVLGTTPAGQRGIYPVTGGRFEGPRLRGIVVGGTDWALKRADGSYKIDVRTTLKTDDGHFIYATYGGYITAPPEVLSALESGSYDDLSSDSYYFRTQLTFETGDGQYAWLNGIIAIGVGHTTPTGVAYRIHEIN